MLWRVSLVTCSDGSEPDSRWSEGCIVEDRREGAFDLIAKALEILAAPGADMCPGEVWEVTPLRDTSRYRVKDDGTLEPA
jgi:hypothetical protein